MDEDDNIAEEGEIIDSDDNYTPLARPENYSSVIPMNRFQPPPESESDDNEDGLLSASDSDSDSDSKCYKAKKPKVKLKPKVSKGAKGKQKKYDIWSTRVQEDVLSETLNSCDVTYKDRSRNVESYDYTLSMGFKANERVNNKRSRSDRKNSDIRLVHRSEGEENDVKGSARILLDLVVTIENTVEEIAKDLANKLCEEKEDLLVKVVNSAGKAKAIEIFRETKRIESEGGMLIMNQTRRRTPGGVFLFLVRHDSDLTEEQLRNIFDEDRQKYKESQKMKKKIKFQKMKQKLGLTGQDKTLPDLLTKAEICVQKLATENNRTRKESTNTDVINPPPTPETDCHENSGDGMDHLDDEKIVNRNDSLDDHRKVAPYELDFLDLGSGNNMDLF